MALADHGNNCTRGPTPRPTIVHAHPSFITRLTHNSVVQPSAIRNLNFWTQLFFLVLVSSLSEKLATLQFFLTIAQLRTSRATHA